MAEPEPEPESQPEPETEDEPKSEFDDQKRLLFALDETPLSNNPFFIVSMANKFKENGTEGAKAGNITAAAYSYKIFYMKFQTYNRYQRIHL